LLFYIYTEFEGQYITKWKQWFPKNIYSNCDLTTIIWKKDWRIILFRKSLNHRFHKRFRSKRWHFIFFFRKKKKYIYIYTIFFLHNLMPLQMKFNDYRKLQPILKKIIKPLIINKQKTNKSSLNILPCLRIRWWWYADQIALQTKSLYSTQD